MGNIIQKLVSVFHADAIGKMGPKYVNLSLPMEAFRCSSNCLINVDQGDPTMFEPYWRELGNICAMMILPCEYMSYISDKENICWFLEAALASAIRNIHREVGNAKSESRHIVVGTGSTQLYQAALYALSSIDAMEPITVVSASPYYSQYPEETDYLCSRLYKWGGDAYKYDKKGPYIEIVNSPNNPDGTIREAVVMKKNGGRGTLIHDLAYYWPQYTPITQLADHDIMLFTLSKCTGHAGSRIGWALVKDTEVAKKMIKFIEFSSIGVSKESQQRAAKILGMASNGYANYRPDNFFEYSERLMAERWEMLREAVKDSKVFSVPEYPIDHCNYLGRFTKPHPAFAWLECKGGMNCEEILREHKMIARGGKRFGADTKYARVSMLSREDVFILLLKRLSAIKEI